VPRALVIGSEGNIGAPLVRRLRDDGYDVLETDIRPGTGGDYVMADINHPVDLLPAFDWGPEIVFVLSAMVSRVTCEQASGLAIATNLAGVNNVLQLCKRVGAMTVYFSTSEVYGPDVELMEETLADPRPNNRYGLSKLLGEKVVEYEVRTYGLRAATLRPFMIYDEYEELGEHRSAMIRFASNLAAGKPVEVHRGSARGWMHISDAVRAVEAAARVRAYTVINVGHPDVRPIEELAELVRAELGAPEELLRLVDLPPQMTLVKRPSLERQRTILGVESEVSLEDGVRRVCETMRRRLAAAVTAPR
jgi:nucleoside-diphosphate-sugar epimerase